MFIWRAKNFTEPSADYLYRVSIGLHESSLNWTGFQFTHRRNCFDVSKRTNWNVHDMVSPIPKFILQNSIVCCQTNNWTNQKYSRLGNCELVRPYYEQVIDHKISNIWCIICFTYVTIHPNHIYDGQKSEDKIENNHNPIQTSTSQKFQVKK